MPDELGHLRPRPHDAHEAQHLRELVTQLETVLRNGTQAQISSLTFRLRPEDPLVRVAWEPFDLPKGYAQLWFASGFTCGIAPDGSVSS
jgi:hypothetical protein